MSLAYCEICGVLLQSAGSGSDPEGVICDGCFDSRQVVVSDSSEELYPADLIPSQPVQFECVYCRSLLRLPPVAVRTNVKCPQCQEAFFLCPDGRVEARLEGNTTAILDKQSTLRSLTPATPAQTQPIGRAHAKTQPISPVSDSQKQALRDLAARNLDVIQELPERDVLPVDTRRSERLRKLRSAETRDYGPDLDLRPFGVGPGDQDPGIELEPIDSDSDLRASDEGRIDLDVEKLRKRSKTRQLKDKAPKSKKEKGKKKAEPLESSGERSARKERREKRKADAIGRTKQLERTRARSAARAAMLWSLLLLPAGLGLLTMSMTVRGTGFVMRGQLGEQLQRIGAAADGGVRTLNAKLPDGARLVLPQRPPETEGD